MRLPHWDGLSIRSSRQASKSKALTLSEFITLLRSGVGTEIGCPISLILWPNMEIGMNIVYSTNGRWFRIWEYFLAYSTIISRQGSASCYQIVMHKVYLTSGNDSRQNLNAFHRINGVPTQYGLKVPGLGRKNWAQSIKYS